jgi:2'-5' RNA ligase
MPDLTRTFVAIPLSEPVRAAVERLRGRIQAEIQGARWVEPRNYHVTLAFLGDVPHADLAEVCRAVTAAAAAHAPFDLTVHGLGAYPTPARPRVLWAGLTGPGVESLRSLHADLERALRQLGYPPDDRFSPHVTLARFKPGKAPAPDLTALVERHAGRWQAGNLRVDEVLVYSSSPDPEGPTYTVLSRGPLRGEETSETP